MKIDFLPIKGFKTELLCLCSKKLSIKVDYSNYGDRRHSIAYFYIHTWITFAKPNINQEQSEKEKKISYSRVFVTVDAFEAETL